MSNHYHWLLKTPRTNLMAGMRWFHSCYTARYNRRYRKAGHLFQGRTRRMLVEAGGNAYFAAVTDLHSSQPGAGQTGSAAARTKRARLQSGVA
jgi:hypothetical protein